MCHADIRTIQRLDRNAFGGSRSALLADVAARGAPGVVDRDGGGFALSRAGRIAHQIGPVVAPNEGAAIALFDRLQGALHTPAFIDIPDIHRDFTRHVQAAGFTRQRPFKRMKRGTHPLQGPKAMFALFGPELG